MGFSAKSMISPRHSGRHSGTVEPESTAQEGVVAVVVERGDRTCTLFCRGSGGTWPSIDEAKDEVKKISTQIVWPETTRGVWVARADVNEPPTLDRGSGHSRRTDPTTPTRASAEGDSYMAARVLRGTARAGQSSRIQHGPRAGSDVDVQSHKGVS